MDHRGRGPRPLPHHTLPRRTTPVLAEIIPSRDVTTTGARRICETIILAGRTTIRMNGVQVSPEVSVPSKSKSARFISDDVDGYGEVSS